MGKNHLGDWGYESLIIVGGFFFPIELRKCMVMNGMSSAGGMAFPQMAIKTKR
jgi:hypothetical protein